MRDPFQPLTMRFGGDNVTLTRTVWEHLYEALINGDPDDEAKRIEDLLMADGEDAA